MKKIILILLIFLISGCSVNYELNISEDLSVTENFSVLNDKSYFDMLGNVEDAYKQVVDAGMKTTNYTTFEYLKENDLYGVKVNHTYSSLIDFKQNAQSYKKLYDDIEISKNDNIMLISSLGKLKIVPSLSNKIEDKDQLLINKFICSIKLPYKVTMHNADRVDKQNNIYYWDITNETAEDKNFQLEFDTSQKFISMQNIISKLDYTLVLIIVIILFGLITYIQIKEKNRKNNKI